MIYCTSEIYSPLHAATYVAAYVAPCSTRRKESSACRKGPQHENCTKKVVLNVISYGNIEWSCTFRVVEPACRFKETPKDNTIDGRKNRN